MHFIKISCDLVKKRKLFVLGTERFKPIIDSRVCIFQKLTHSGCKAVIIKINRFSQDICCVQYARFQLIVLWFHGKNCNQSYCKSEIFIQRINCRQASDSEIFKPEMLLLKAKIFLNSPALKIIFNDLYGIFLAVNFTVCYKHHRCFSQAVYENCFERLS